MSKWVKMGYNKSATENALLWGERMKAISLFIDPDSELSQAIETALANGTLKSRKFKLNAGEYLFMEGETVHETFYIHRGLVQLFSTTPLGQTKTVFFYKAGTLIGYQELQKNTVGKPTILSAQATANCELSAIDAKSITSLFQTDGKVGFLFTQFLFKQLSMQAREAVNATAYSTLERFSALLLALCRNMGSMQAPAIIPFANEELARMLGVHPNSITNAVNNLRKANCVDRRRNLLMVTDFKKLKTIAGSLIEES